MKEKIKALFVNNIGMKLLSLLLAVIAWCAIMNSSDPSVTVTVKNITVQKNNEDAVVDENMIYEVESSDTIDISVTGPRSVVQSLNASDIRAYIDLEEISLTEACPIHVEFINSSKYKYVEIVSKSKEVMKLKLEQMVSENKQVHVNLVGEEPEGYYAIASVSPNILSVYGSITSVNMIEKLVADVDISGKYSSFETTVNVIPYDSNGQPVDSGNVKIDNSNVTVSVNVYKTKNINVVIDSDITTEYGFAAEEIKQAPGVITIAGPATALSAITEIHVPFSAKDINETINQDISLADYIPAECYLVSDISSVSITVPVSIMNENKSVNATIRSIKVENLISPLEITNLSDGFALNVWGVEGQTEGLTLSDFNISLDASSIKEPGEYEMKLNISTAKTVIVDDISVTLKVKLKE